MILTISQGDRTGSSDSLGEAHQINDSRIDRVERSSTECIRVTVWYQLKECWVRSGKLTLISILSTKVNLVYSFCFQIIG